jgi:hypothetical protein
MSSENEERFQSQLFPSSSKIGGMFEFDSFKLTDRNINLVV